MENLEQIDYMFQALILLGVWMYGKFMYNDYQDRNKD